MAAGVAFYAFLSFVPLLGALIMTYGLIADPALVANHLKVIIDLVPADAARLIYEQLVDLTTAAGEKKGFGLIIALGVSRSEEHTSELQSLMRISYAVFCLKKKNKSTVIRLSY